MAKIDTLDKTTSLRLALNELIVAVQCEDSVPGWTDRAMEKARKVIRDTE